MHTKSSELLIEIQKNWEEAQRQLAELRKQVEGRVVFEKLLSEKERAEEKRQEALSDLGWVVYEEIQRGALRPPTHWEGLLERIRGVLKKTQEQRQRLSELLDEGQAMVEQAEGATKEL